jgi:ABC-2 type transport system ATP-binding protein
VLEISDLHREFGDLVALDDASLEVDAGEIVGLVGRNGAGKTTLMRSVMGIIEPDRGTITWNGHPIGEADRLRFGYMPEERGLYPKMRVVDQIAYFGRLHGMPKLPAQAAAAELITQMNVLAAPNALVQALSLGNQQRVQLAAALVHDPELLILDEPFSGLDPVGVDTMADVLRERRGRGVGVLFSSHQLELVERLCDRVVIIQHGRVVAAGTLPELRAAGGRRELEVAVDAPLSWLAQLPGVHHVATVDGRLRLHLDDPGADQSVLAAASQAGRVEYFGWRQPPLAELYREAVQE